MTMAVLSAQDGSDTTQSCTQESDLQEMKAAASLSLLCSFERTAIHRMIYRPALQQFYIVAIYTV